MMRALIAAAAAACVLSGCESTTVAVTPVTWQATLAGLPGWEHLGGTSEVQWTPGTAAFAASAQIQGDASGAVRPWHVHHNTCAQGGGIVGGDGAYPRLNVGADGTATATATVPAALDRTASYHVNVHLSVPEMATIIMCGDLTITGG